MSAGSAGSAASRPWLRWAVLAVALVLGTWLRLRELAALPLHGDEYHTLAAADSAYGAILGTFDDVGSHVALPLLQRLALDVFGDGIVPFRLVAIVPGLLFLFLAYPLLRAFVSADAAALAAAALALNPMVVYYARFARGYALALLFALVLGWAVKRVLDPSASPALLAAARPWRARLPWIALVASAALLPWVHLSALGFVAAVGLAGIALATRRGARRALRVGGAFALAAGLAFALFLPVLGQVVTYFRVMESEPPPLTWFGVPTLLAGGRAAAWTWMALVALGVAGAARAWRAERTSVVLTLAALAGPLALLLATNPRGMDYAWARYILSALPFLAALAAAGLIALVRRVGRSETSGLALGALLVLAHFLTGPLAPARARAAAFSNTYLALHPLPAFDEPWPGMPDFYRQLAEDPAARRIVVVPWLATRAVLAYRNYALQHGKDVLVGWIGELPRGIRRGPYLRAHELAPGAADWLVLHRDQSAEIPAYFRHVYELVWPRVRIPADDTFMARQETIYPQNLFGPEVGDGLAGQFRARYGAAAHKDERVLAWKLPAAARGE
jgi:hypothetical protein